MCKHDSATLFFDILATMFAKLCGACHVSLETFIFHYTSRKTILITIVSSPVMWGQINGLFTYLTFTVKVFIIQYVWYKYFLPSYQVTCKSTSRNYDIIYGIIIVQQSVLFAKKLQTVAALQLHTRAIQARECALHTQ